MTLDLDEPSSGGIDPDRFLRATTTWSLALGGIGVVVAAVLTTWPVAWGVAAGCAIGWANLKLTARAILKMFARAEDYRGRRYAPVASLLVKWPALLAVLGLVLLYAPVAPEGVAAGVVLSLAAASVAAVRSRRTLQADPSDEPA